MHDLIFHKTELCGVVPTLLNLHPKCLQDNYTSEFAREKPELLRRGESRLKPEIKKTWMCQKMPPSVSLF